LDWKVLLAGYERRHGHSLEPVRVRRTSVAVPSHILCVHCGAPALYLYFNNGKLRSQIGCKVCQNFFSLPRAFQKSKRTKYYCPHCNYALYVWKNTAEVTIYKCGYDQCAIYVQRFAQLNAAEKKLQPQKSSQFKLRYQFREYHFKAKQLEHSQPEPQRIDLRRIHRSENVVGLVLAFHISFGLPSRTTARVLREVFQIAISYQTVLNYSQAAAFYFHGFNLRHKGDVGAVQAGDETYIKIAGQHWYVFFFIAQERRQITAYHVADNRGTLPATVALLEATRTVEPEIQPEITTDGNPSYPAALHFMNAQRLKDHKPPIQLHQVIGLENLDTESETYRKFKQLIERLNRTYKGNIRPLHGFGDDNGAICSTTLFVTDYNFLRPHSTLHGDVPIPLAELKGLPTIQNKWSVLLNRAFELEPPPSTVTAEQSLTRILREYTRRSNRSA
jgi:transposase-like protein